MTVATLSNKAIATGNGVATTYPFTFATLPSGDLEVTLFDLDNVAIPQTEPTNYTVLGEGSEDGGAVVFVVAPPVDYTVLIQRVVAVLQPDDLKNQGSYYPRTVERMLDRQTMISQQLTERLASALTLPAQVQGVSVTLPVPSALAPLVWNADADALENGSTALTGDMLLRGDLFQSDAAKGAALVRFADPVAPAFLKTLSDITNGAPVSALRVIPTTSYAAVRAGTYAPDVRNSLLDVLTAMGTAKYGELTIPRGLLNITTGNLPIPANITIRGESRNGSVLKFAASGQNGVVLGQGAEAHDLTVDGNNAATGCFFIDTTNSAVIDNCTALNAAAHGFAVSNSYGCQLSNLRAITAGSRGFLIDPNSYDNQLTNIYARGCTNAGLLIGHNSLGYVIRGLTLIDTGNAALWIHQEAYNNAVSDIRISGTTAASGTPAMLLMANAYGNTVKNFNIRSYEIGVLLRGSVVDATYTAGKTRRNTVSHGVMVGTGAAVSGSAASKCDSLDAGVTTAEFNRLFAITATDYNNGVLDPGGNAMFDNHIHDCDFSTSITNKWSAATKNARNRIHHIRGYTPFGDATLLIPPDPAATGVAVTNPFAFSVDIYVDALPAGGQVQIGAGYVSPGTSPNNGNGVYNLAPGQTITLNYASGTPEWIWFGLDG